MKQRRFRYFGAALGTSAVGLAIVLLLTACPAPASSFESFLEPAHQADLIPANRDVIQKIHVKEGDTVKKGQILVSLTADTLKARLQAATIMAEARGKIDSALVMEKLRQEQLDDLTNLAKSGNVRAKELDRARADLAIAMADLQTMQEERRIRMAEQEQIKAQIAEREIRSPIDGTVTHLSKEEGELTGTSDQDILVTIVQEHPLQAIFHLPAGVATTLKQGQEVPISLEQGTEIVTGRIMFISPVTNPESATVKVKVRIVDNKTLQAGLRCHLNFADPGDGPVVQGLPQ
jgi:membrane fusion protein (multidrug efflux system)